MVGDPDDLRFAKQHHADAYGVDCEVHRMSKHKYYPWLHKNSFNAIETSVPQSSPMRPLMHMLAAIGYVLSDILEVLSDEHFEEDAE